MRTPEAELRKIHELENTIHFYRNKQRKAKERELSGLYDEYKFAKQELKYINESNQAYQELEEATISRENTVNYVETQVGLVREILEEGKFEGVREEIARNIKEVHPLMMTDAFEKFSMCDAVDLITFFSCFTNINVNDEMKNHVPKCDSSQAHQLIVMADEQFNHYYNQEGKRNIYTGENYEFHYDLADVMRDWCDTSNEKECEDLLKNLQHTKGIFLGEFVKAVLKINAMAKELEKVSQICGMTDVEHTLSQIGELTLKSVCTSQSLYV